jgi:hypothetical protein
VRGMLESVEQANISERESGEQLALAGGRTDSRGNSHLIGAAAEGWTILSNEIGQPEDCP